MFKLTDNLLHQQIIHNIHLYAPIANILLLLVHFFCYDKGVFLRAQFPRNFF